MKSVPSLPTTASAEGVGEEDCFGMENQATAREGAVARPQHLFQGFPGAYADLVNTLHSTSNEQFADLEIALFKKEVLGKGPGSLRLTNKETRGQILLNLYISDVTAETSNLHDAKRVEYFKELRDAFFKARIGQAVVVMDGVLRSLYREGRHGNEGRYGQTTDDTVSDNTPCALMSRKPLSFPKDN